MIAVVLGRPLSGGSALAAAIVAMGYHPGRTIFGPCAPGFRPDWEDAETTSILIEGARPTSEEWHTIFEVRMQQAAILDCAGPLMKSPLYCLAGKPFYDALTPYSSKIFWVSRDEKDRMNSLKSYKPETRKVLKSIDSEIEDSVADWADVYIDYEDLLLSPLSTLEPITQMLGAEDRLMEAVGTILPRRLQWQ